MSQVARLCFIDTNFKNSYLSYFLLDIYSNFHLLMFLYFWASDLISQWTFPLRNLMKWLFFLFMGSSWYCTWTWRSRGFISMILHIPLWYYLIVCFRTCSSQLIITGRSPSTLHVGHRSTSGTRRTLTPSGHTRGGQTVFTTSSSTQLRLVGLFQYHYYLEMIIITNLQLTTKEVEVPWSSD